MIQYMVIIFLKGWYFMNLDPQDKNNNLKDIEKRLADLEMQHETRKTKWKKVKIVLGVVLAIYLWFAFIGVIQFVKGGS